MSLIASNYRYTATAQGPAGRAAVSAERLGLVYCVAALGIGILRTTTVQLVGAMPVAELVLLVVCAHAGIWMLAAGRLPVEVPSPRLLYILALVQGVAFGSYVITDLWRETEMIDMVRGWMRMIFVLIDLFAIALILGVHERTFIWLQIGSVISCAQLLIEPPLFGDYWKFGFAFPVTVLVFLAAPRLFGFWGFQLGCVGLAALHMQMGYRSMSVTCLVVAAMLMLRTLPRNVRKPFLILGLLMGLVALPAVVDKMFATNGTVGANRSNIERSAMLQAAWDGFVSSPVIGQGSWFSKSQVMDNFLHIREEKEKDAGGGMGFAHNDIEGASIHSQMLVSLAEGGIFGGAFFLAYGILILWALWFALTGSAWSWTLPSRVLLLVGGFFDLWMSPFSGPVRISIATVVILIAIFWRERSLQRAELRFAPIP